MAIQATQDENAKQCYKANENWRRAAYNYLVKDLGLSVGAIIKVKGSLGGYNASFAHNNNAQRIEKVATICSINWDNLNICTAKSWNYDLDWMKQPLYIEILVDGKKQYLSEDRRGLHHQTTGQLTGDRTIVANVNSNYSPWKFAGLLSRSPHELSEEWVTSYKQAFDYLTKKKTFEKLQEVGFVQLVDKWKGRSI